MIYFSLDFVEINAEVSKDFISENKTIEENLKKIFLEATDKNKYELDLPESQKETIRSILRGTHQKE